MMNDADNSVIFSADWDLPMMDTIDEPTNDFVLESWQADQDPSSSSSVLPGDYDDDEDLMMVDAVHVFEGDDEIPPTPPAGRLLLEEALEETLAAAAQHDDDDDSFFTAHSGNDLSHGSPSAHLTSFLPLEQRYQATLEKLSESMKRSQETRKSLRIQTTETMEYNRWSTISGTLSSIEKSTKQLEQYLKNNKPAQIL